MKYTNHYNKKLYCQKCVFGNKQNNSFDYLLAYNRL